jgi:hypothetical protein
MVLLIVAICHVSLQVYGWSSNRCDGALLADSSPVAA